MKKKKKWVFPVVSLLVVALIAVFPFLLQRKKNAEENSGDDLRTAAVQKSTVATTLSGTGTLTAQDSEEISVPDGVEVTGYLVSNGDMVTKGQPLVSVDPVTVRAAIRSCKDTIDYLEEKMFELEYHEATRYIMVPANGKVTHIYCEPGDRVSDVMLEHGCLATIEIDGQEWKAQAFTGTVKYVNAYEGEQVYAHSSFIWLDDLADASEYDTYLVQHQDYADLLSDLFLMYETGAICAPCDGMIDGIDREEVKKVQDVGEADVIGQITELEEAERKSALSGAAGEFDPANLSAMPGSFDRDRLSEGFDPTDRPESFPPAEGSDLPDVAPAKAPVGAGNTVKAAPAVSVSGNGSTSSEVIVLPDSGLVYTGAKQKIVIADQISEGGEGGELKVEQTMLLALDLGAGVRLFEGQKDVTDIVKFDMNPGAAMGIAPNDAIVCAKIRTGDSEPAYYAVMNQSQEIAKLTKQLMEGPLKEYMDAMKGMMGGFGGLSMQASSSVTEEYVLYPLEGTKVMDVIPQETLSIDITLDELDILSAEVGQEARITIDALPGRSYSGTVTKINSDASKNNGGHTKYAATVTMENDEDLLAGMNASTQITISEKEGILTLPAKALYEIAGKTYVYSGYDEKLGELTGRKEVQTGISDGENVEILSGLEEGDEVTFRYSDTIDVDKIVTQPQVSLASMMGY